MLLHSEILRGANKAQPHVLLDLPPALLDAYTAGSLVLRSDVDQRRVVACSASETFLLSLAPQNPTVLLTKPSAQPAGSTAVGVIEKRLQPTPIAGEIDWDKTAVYFNATINGPTESMDDLRARSLCSDTEFDALFREKPGTVIDGAVARVDPTVIFAVAGELAATVVAEELEPSAAFETLYEKLDIQRPVEVVKAVYGKFAANGTLDLEKMALWIGIYLLQKQGEKHEPIRKFMDQWAHELPMRSLKYDLAMLRGHYVEFPGAKIRSLEVSELPTEPRSRFQTLFALKESWPVSDIAPYLEDIAHKKMKLEAWIKKYARISSGMVQPRRG